MALIKKLNNGYSIVQLIIVIVVIGILAAITTISYSGWREKSEATRLASDAKMLYSAIQNYVNFNNSYPTNPELPNLFKLSSGESAYIISGSDGTFEAIVEKDGKSYGSSGASDAKQHVIMNGLKVFLDVTDLKSYNNDANPATWNNLANMLGSVGTIQPSIEYSSVNKSLKFDATASSLLTISNPISQTTTNQSWTIMSDVKLNAYQSAQQVMNFNKGVFFIYSIDGANARPGSPLLYLNSVSPNNYYSYGKISNQFDINNWHVGTFVFDNSIKRKDIFINNSQVNDYGPTPSPNPALTSASLPTTINIGSGLFGEIGRIILYDRALSVAEINNNFKALCIERAICSQ